MHDILSWGCEVCIEGSWACMWCAYARPSCRGAALSKRKRGLRQYESLAERSYWARYGQKFTLRVERTWHPTGTLDAAPAWLIGIKANQHYYKQQLT